MSAHDHAGLERQARYILRPPFAQERLRSDGRIALELKTPWHDGTRELFQFFNVFNARNENGTSFNAHVFHNAMLWSSLAGVVGLQAVAVHWPPAQAIFGTGGMTLADWASPPAWPLLSCYLKKGAS